MQKRNAAEVFLKILFLVLTGMVLFLIFGFSAQEGTESTGISRRVAGLAVLFFDKLGDLNLTTVDQMQFVSWILVPIRKLGHLSEYALLGFLLFWDIGFLFPKYRKQKGSWFLITLLLVVVFAASDEFHQIFVPGRDGNLIDVGIDTVGSIGGIMVGNFLFDAAYALYQKLSCHK